jgi:hypothetical protein
VPSPLWGQNPFVGGEPKIIVGAEHHHVDAIDYGPAAPAAADQPLVVVGILVSHLVATTSKARLRATPSRVTPDQLAAIQRQIALAMVLMHTGPRRSSTAAQ